MSPGDAVRSLRHDLAAVSGDGTMSWRARAFVLVLAFRHLCVGAFCLFAADQFTSTSYEVLRRMLPLEVWGVLLIAVGVHAILAVAYRNEVWVRLVVIISAGITAAWAVAFTTSALRGQLDAPPLPATWAVLTLKDLIIAAMPMRTPFEDAARRRGYLQ